MKINKRKLDILQCRAGLTGTQVAQKAGIKPQSYSAVKVRGSCAAPTVAAIATALGVDVTDIVDEDG